MICMGIDPGYNGGIAFFNDRKRVITFIMPVIKEIIIIKDKKKIKTVYDCYEIKRMLLYYKPDTIIIEKQHLSAVDGKISNTAIVGGYNLLKGMAYMYLKNESDLIDVHPLTWHKAILGKSRMDREESKRLAEAKALELFTGYNFKRTKRCIKNHDGMIDAVLLTYYGYLMKG